MPACISLRPCTFQSQARQDYEKRKIMSCNFLMWIIRWLWLYALPLSLGLVPWIRPYVCLVWKCKTRHGKKMRVDDNSNMDHGYKNTWNDGTEPSQYATIITFLYFYLQFTRTGQKLVFFLQSINNDQQQLKNQQNKSYYRVAACWRKRQPVSRYFYLLCVTLLSIP